MNQTEIKRQLFHPRTNKYQFLAQLKHQTDYKTFKKYIKGIEKHPFGKHALLSTPFPDTYKQIRQNNIIPHASSLESEMAWLLYSIKGHPDKIIIFNKLFNQYENYILLNEYDKAEKILNEIEEKVGLSIWGLKQHLLLQEDKNGTEENWKLLSKYSKTLKDPLALFIIEQYSKIIEHKFSYIRYRVNFDNFLKDSSNLLKEYLSFQVLYTAYTGFQNYSFIINVETISPLIDRYLLLRKILIEILLTKNKTLLKEVMIDLQEIIQSDKALQQISNIIIEKNHYFFKEENKDFFYILDKYTKGEYKYCLSNIPILLVKYPNSFELYIIYVKSLLEISNNKFIKTNISKNIDEILENIFSIYKVDDNYNDAIEHLLKLSLKYFSFDIGKQLFSFISQEMNLLDENKTHRFYYYIHSKFNNPLIFESLHLLPSNNQTNIIDLFSKINNSAKQVNYEIHNGNFDKIEKENQINRNRTILYKAKNYYNNKEFEKIYKLLSNLNINQFNNVHTYKELIELLYDSYLQNENYKRALLLYVNNFFINKNFVFRLDNNKLANEIDFEVNRNAEIEFPIFCFLSNPDVYEQYVAYDVFLSALNLSKPSELFGNINIENEKLIFFLREICSIDVMHHSIYFEGTEDVEKERIKILKFLLSADSKNEEEYIKEISELTQKAKIRKALSEVNKGRITINTQQLKNKEEKNIKESFNRYKELLIFSESNNLTTIDATSKMLDDYFKEQNINEKVVFLNDPAFIAFKSMFLDLRDKFILSKDFGLDGYLSTRIRHGTLLNHIRSIFEKHNIISQKQGNDYIENSYWVNKCPKHLKSKIQDIQNSIKNFSKEIDEFTELIIKQYIQVKTEEKQDKSYAFFDFSLNNEDLAYLFSKSRKHILTYTSFLDFIFEFLEAKTNIILENIRKIIKTDIKNQYNKIIDKLDSNIHQVLNGESFIDLTNSIVTCKTNLQNELDNISEWFNISDPSNDNKLDIETIIQTAIEITNTLNPNYILKPKITYDKVNDIWGDVNLIYIIRILLDNIIKHSNIPSSDCVTMIDVELEKEYLKLTIRNNVNTNVKKTIIKNLDQVKEKWDKKEDFSKINIEGGSGLDKVRKILSVDLKMKNYKFDYKINDDIISIIIFMEVKFYNN